jgi:hypothetical protein
MVNTPDSWKPARACSVTRVRPAATTIGSEHWPPMTSMSCEDVSASSMVKVNVSPNTV